MSVSAKEGEITLDEVLQEDGYRITKVGADVTDGEQHTACSLHILYVPRVLLHRNSSFRFCPVPFLSEEISQWTRSDLAVGPGRSEVTFYLFTNLYCYDILWHIAATCVSNIT